MSNRRKGFVFHLVVVSLALVLPAAARAGDLPYEDVQTCTNAYNHFWWTYETVKSDLRGNPAAQAEALQTEFAKLLDPSFHLEMVNVPIPPGFDSTISFTIDGIPDLVQTAAFGIDNFGEHHVATPFSVQRTSISKGSKVYSMTTRDVAYTRDPSADGGCTVYLAQKTTVCSVQGDKALLKSLVNNVVTSYRIPAPQCGLWIAAPVAPY